MALKSYPRLFAPALSFMLPGLGQLYQRQIPLACAIFAGFTLLNLFEAMRLLAPLLVGFASWEAYRRELRWKAAGVETVAGLGSPRTLAFSAVAGIGFLGWMALIAPVFLPVGLQLQLNDQVDALVRDVRACRRAQGSLPASLEDCLRVQGSRVSPNDPWGSPWLYRPRGEGFELRSMGRDRKADTEDDLVYRFRH